jgi:hypothetical protein
MKYVISYVNKPGAVPTLEDECVDTLAEECRDAALSFVNGVARGWTKRDLALWLAGPYRHATRHATGGERTADMATVDDVHEGILAEDRVADLMARARADVRARLDDVALLSSEAAGAVEFVHEAVRRRAIAPRVDADGMSLWVPVDGRTMSLRDRVLSLFACDYLMRPDDYAHDLAVCPKCDLVQIDPTAKRTGDCGGHRRISGIVGPGAEGDDADAGGEQDVG